MRCSLLESIRTDILDFYAECKPKIEPITEKAKKISIVVLKILAAFVLFYTNATFFLAGILLGVIFPRQANEAVLKIINAWNRLYLPLKVLGAILAFLALPGGMAAISLIYGAYLSSEDSLNHEKHIYHKIEV